MTKQAETDASSHVLERRQTRIIQILNFSLVATAITVLGFTLYLFFEGYSPVQFADSWTVLMAYQDAGFHVTLKDLLAFHNEHRPLFARVPILIDTLRFGERGILPFGLILLTQAGHAWLLTHIARKLVDSRHLPLVAALAVFCCFSPAQLENFIWSFQIAFVLNFLFATAALAAVAAQKQSGSAKWAAFAMLCASCAPLCLASGVLVWWLAAATAAALRLSRTWILAYLGGGVLTLILYVQGYPSASNHSIADILRDPLGILQYVAYFLGWSWKWWTIPFGEVLALVALVLMMRRILALIRKEPTNPWEAIPAGVMLFTLGTGLMAAMGRLNYGLEQAGSSRYQTPVLLFWFMAALLVLKELRDRPVRAVLAFQLFVLVAMLSVFPASSGTIEIVRHRRIGWDIAVAAWVSGVQDGTSLDAMVAGTQLGLRRDYGERHLGWFSVRPGSELGSRLAPDRIQLGSYCEGSFRRDEFFASPDWPGVRLSGSARIAATGEPIYHFLTTTTDLRVVGLGAAGVAFAHVTKERERLIVYGLLDDGKVCAVRVDSP